MYLLLISWSEILIVGFIALLLFGADKIPEFARTAGKMMGEYRKVRDSLRDEIRDAKEEIDKELNDDEEEPVTRLESIVDPDDDEAYRDL